MEKDQAKGTGVGFLEPERIVANFGLKPGDHAADFGAGHGYFTIFLARAVGGDGMVYAVDVQKTGLDIIRAKAQMEHLLNIEYVWADMDRAQGSGLKDKFIDFVMMGSILFQAENKLAIIEEAYRVLREGGRMAMIEWGESADSLGPAVALRVKKEDARSLALQAGFEFDREYAAGSHHYGLLFVKK